MYALHNNLSAAEAKALLAQETVPRQTLSFYRYVIYEDPQASRDAYYAAWSKLGVLGRIYLAKEGINAQISIPKDRLDAFRALLDADAHLAQVPWKYALEEPAISFWKLTMKVRRQIVADNLPEGSYNMEHVGEHLSPKAFHEEVAKGALVVDMRNAYESAIGKFTGAQTPQAQTFSDELREVAQTLRAKKDEKVLLYCTGGIRCEKASAFLKQEGFSQVYQLEGGIIAYANAMKESGTPSLFKGKNFVFDGRMSETVTPDILGTCFTCKSPADSYDNCTNDLCHALFIQCQPCKERLQGACSEDCFSIAKLSENERKALRKGKKAVFSIHTSEGLEEAALA